MWIYDIFLPLYFNKQLKKILKINAGKKLQIPANVRLKNYSHSALFRLIMLVLCHIVPSAACIFRATVILIHHIMAASFHLLYALTLITKIFFCYMFALLPNISWCLWLWRWKRVSRSWMHKRKNFFLLEERALEKLWCKAILIAQIFYNERLMMNIF